MQRLKQKGRDLERDLGVGGRTEKGILHVKVVSTHGYYNSNYRLFISLILSLVRGTTEYAK